MDNFSRRVVFDARVYALPVIKKAAYRFLKIFDTEIVQEGETWVCVLNCAPSSSSANCEQAVREFRAEVLDQDLRASIARETEPVRNAILAIAFSRTGLQGSE